MRKLFLTLALCLLAVLVGYRTGRHAAETATVPAPSPERATRATSESGFFIPFMGARVTDAQFAQLAEKSLNGATELSLGNTEITDVSLSLLKGHQLSWLGLQHTEIHDTGVRELAELPELKTLLLDNTKISDAALPALAKLPLRKLSLDFTGVTDKGVAFLSPLRLEYLSLSGTNITDEGVRKLAQMPLTTLRLDGTNVTDASFDDLMKLPLQELSISKTKITHETINRMRAERPNLIVEFRDEQMIGKRREAPYNKSLDASR